MKPLSVEMTGLLGIQNEIQAVWEDLNNKEHLQPPFFTKCTSQHIWLKSLNS